MDFQSLIKLILFYMNLIGINPLTISFRNEALSYFTMFSVIFFSSWYCTGIYETWNGIDSVADSSLLPPLTLVVFELTTIVYYKQNVRRVLLMIEEFWPVDYFPDNESTMKRIHRTSFRIGLAYYVLAYLCGSFIFLVPFLSRTLPMNLHPRCDLDSSPCFIIMTVGLNFYFFFQCIPIALIFDGLFVAFIAQAYAGLENLKIAIGKLDLANSSEEIALEKINRIAAQHELIFRFLKELKDVYSMPLLVFFMFSSASQVVAFYMLTFEGIIPTFNAFVKFGAYLTILYAQMLYYSLASSILEEQLSSIGNAIYDVDWTCKTNAKIRRVLAFILQRSQIDESFTIGKMSKLNLESFVSITRKVLSIYTILRETTSKQ